MPRDGPETGIGSHGDPLSGYYKCPINVFVTTLILVKENAVGL